MNPVHAISDVLEHALVGHEKVTIFEASLTTTGNSKKSVINLGLLIKEGYVTNIIQHAKQHLVYLGQLLKKSTKQAKRYVSAENTRAENFSWCNNIQCNTLLYQVHRTTAKNSNINLNFMQRNMFNSSTPVIYY